MKVPDVMAQQLMPQTPALTVPTPPIGSDRTAPVEGSEGAEGPFVELLSNALEEVNATQQNAEGLVADFVAGEDVPVHRVMIELTKADAAVRLTTAVATRVIDAYQEVARLQI